MKLTLIILIILTIKWFASSKEDNLIQMVKFYLKNENSPTFLITPKLCWTHHERVKLSKELFKENINTGDDFDLHRNEQVLQQLVIMVDLECPGLDSLLIEASKLKYFKAPYRWLMLSAFEAELNILTGLPIMVDSNIVIAEVISSNSELESKSYKFYEVYKISEESRLKKLPRGYWYSKESEKTLLNINGSQIKTFDNKTKFNKINNSNIDLELEGFESHADEVILKEGLQSEIYIDVRESNIVSRRRYNLEKRPLTMANVITDHNDTKVHLDDRLDLHHDSITKTSAMVVSVCFEILNATERRIFSNTWGYRDKNGNWSGVINQMLKNEADLGTMTIFTRERSEVIDYIAMAGTTAVKFVFREPPLSYVSNIFTLPFNGSVWCSIIVCVIGCSLFLYVTSKWEASMGMHPLQLDGSWADVLILMIGAILQQGCTLEPRYAAGRCVTLFVFLTLTLLYAAYSANIVVLLRASSFSVRTLSELLESPLKIGASDFEYNRYFFKKLNDSIRKDIYNKKIAPVGKKPNFYTMSEGIEKIRQGLFAFHMELNPGYRLIQDTYQEDEKCNLVEIDFINEINPWIPGQKRSPYKELFKINFLRIRESGIQSCIHRRLIVPRPSCSGTIVSFSSVGLRDIYPALLMTLYGFLVAPALLVCELAYLKLQVQRAGRARKQEKRRVTSLAWVD